ncbi:hypothetical protein [Lacinutrix sp. Hel_I_90]|uniref:hypothetical protein n=1 Tax=Lacinutrix sp. Hel_I_90 TaxID=1249999 RepID=UPI0005CB0F87|nr:hypothetical protein [Lacinutrix sp. Hel_I_90]
MKIRVLCACLFICVFAYSQESDSKLAFYSISFSPINIYFDHHTSGLAASLDISLKKDKDIYKLFGLTGSEFVVSVLGPSKVESFHEIDILYGKELREGKWLYFDFYSGLSYFSHTINTPEKIPGSGTNSGGFSFTTYEYSYNEDKNNTIGLVLQSNIRFRTGKRFSMGLQFHSNINTVNTIFSTGLLLHWKLGRKSKLD